MNVKELGVAVDQTFIEANVDAELQRKLAFFIHRRFERIVSFADVKGQQRGVGADLVPGMGTESVGELLAVNADLPRQQPLDGEGMLSEGRYGGLVIAGQGGKGKVAVMVEMNELVLAFAEILSAACDGSVTRNIRYCLLASKYGRISSGRVSTALLTIRRWPLSPQLRATEARPNTAATSAKMAHIDEKRRLPR